MQADKKEPAAAASPAVPAAGKPPSICNRLQKAFHARPAFRPLRRLTVRHEDGGGAAKPAGAAGAKPAGGASDGAAKPAGGAPKHSGPPLPAPPRPLTQSPAPKAEKPAPVRLPAATSKVAAGNAPTGPPVPVPPPDVLAGMATAAGDDAKAAGDEGQQSKGKTRVGSRVRKALPSK